MCVCVCVCVVTGDIKVQSGLYWPMLTGCSVVVVMEPSKCGILQTYAKAV